MSKKRYALWQLLLAMLGSVLLTLAVTATALWLVLGPETLAMLQAWGIVNTRFVGEYDRGETVDAALNGMVQGLGDRWSYYLDAESLASQNQRRNNRYVGVGVTVNYTDPRGLLIVAVKKDGPAYQAGLLPGEVITVVDGFSLAGEANQQEGSERIQGEAGTVVKLTVVDAEGKERQVEVTRASIENDSVTEYTLLDNGVGYVALGNFYSGSGNQLNTAVDELMEQGATAFVFDMRNNGGGYVHELTAMLDHLLPEGPIFRSKTKTGREEVTQSDESSIDLPMAILVNGNTYSAAEFFAAQLKETAGSVIVGEPTSGKGFSQQTLDLVNGGALNISTGKYFTGGGVSLIGTGLTLDAEVILDEEQTLALYAGTLLPEEDPQLQKALELLGK
ncbi:MAG: PDZ domain-containing protein [Oscillospiraceae bacterium]|nr:PDZ domain-containing protein [Oscillospiraceae bacterium]